VNQQSSKTSPLASPAHLPRVVGLAFGIAVIIGGTVGAGILRTPGIVANYLGRPDLILFAWLLVGGLAALGANCYAELATAMPIAGGSFVYVRRCCGGFAGFAAGWSEWFIQVCALAYISVAFGEYVSGLFPAIDGHEKFLAIATLASLTALNWLGMRVGAVFQEWMSAAKLLALLGVIVACLIAGNPSGSLAVNGYSPAATTPLAIAAAMLLSIRTITETYAGWNGIVFFSEDQQEPSKNIPRSLFWGVLSVVVLYVLVNIALLRTLPMSVLAASKLPIADAAQLVFGGLSSRIVTVISIISLLGILNVAVMGAPRILVGLGRYGLMVASAGRLNHAGVPGVAMVVTSGAAAILVSANSFETLFGIAGFLGIAFDVAVYVSFFRLRRTEPELLRPYRARGYPILPGIALAVSCCFFLGLVIDDPKTSVFTIALLAASYPLYAKLRRPPEHVRELRDKE
jgi:APA family basic amino acid/polyamine antiporter